MFAGAVEQRIPSGPQGEREQDDHEERGTVEAGEEGCAVDNDKRREVGERICYIKSVPSRFSSSHDVLSVSSNCHLLFSMFFKGKFLPSIRRHIP